jgi:hypothetical protein
MFGRIILLPSQGGRGIYNTVVCESMDNKLYGKH